MCFYWGLKTYVHFPIRSYAWSPVRDCFSERKMRESAPGKTFIFNWEPSMATTFQKKITICTKWSMVLITGFTLGGCRLSSSSQLQSEPISINNSHPIKFVGVDSDGGECSYSTKFTEDGKSLEIQVEANDLRAYVSILKKDIPLSDGFKKDLSTPREKTNIFYKGNKFNWDRRGTTDFLEHSWLDLQIDNQLVIPVEFSMGVGFGPLPSITKGKCSKLKMADQ